MPHQAHLYGVWSTLCCVGVKTRVKKHRDVIKVSLRGKPACWKFGVSFPVVLVPSPSSCTPNTLFNLVSSRGMPLDHWNIQLLNPKCIIQQPWRQSFLSRGDKRLINKYMTCWFVILNDRQQFAVGWFDMVWEYISGIVQLIWPAWQRISQICHSHWVQNNQNSEEIPIGAGNVWHYPAGSQDTCWC